MFLILAVLLLLFGYPGWALISLIISLCIGIYANRKRT